MVKRRSLIYIFGLLLTAMLAAGASAAEKLKVGTTVKVYSGY